MKSLIHPLSLKLKKAMQHRKLHMKKYCSTSTYKAIQLSLLQLEKRLN